MKSTRTIMIIVFLSQLFISCLSQKALTDEVQSNKTFLINNKAEFKNIKLVALFIKGDDKELGYILHDALSTKLKQFAWTVIDRTQLESAINKDYLAKQKKSLEDSSGIAPLSFDEMSKLVNADHYVIIDFSVGKKQYSNLINSFGNAAIEKIVISSISFRIFTTGTSELIAIGVFDFLNGQSPTYAATFVRNLIDEMKRDEITK